MKTFLILISLLSLITAQDAQVLPPHPELENPSIQGINKEYPHVTFIRYDSYENALILRLKKHWSIYMEWYSLDGERFELFGISDILLKDIKAVMLVGDGI